MDKKPLQVVEQIYVKSRKPAKMLHDLSYTICARKWGFYLTQRTQEKYATNATDVVDAMQRLS